MKQTLLSVGLTSLILASAGYSQDKIEGNEDGGVETITVTGDRPGVGASANPGVVIGGPGTISGAGGSGGAGGGEGRGPAKTDKKKQEESNKKAKEKIGAKKIVEKSAIETFLQKIKETFALFGSKDIGTRVRVIEYPDGTKVYEACAAYQAGEASVKKANICVDQRIEKFTMPDGSQMLRFTHIPVVQPCASYDSRFDAIFWACTPDEAFEVYGNTVEEIAWALGLQLD